MYPLRMETVFALATTALLVGIEGRPRERPSGILQLDVTTGQKVINYISEHPETLTPSGVSPAILEGKILPQVRFASDEKAEEKAQAKRHRLERARRSSRDKRTRHVRHVKNEDQSGKPIGDSGVMVKRRAKHREEQFEDDGIMRAIRERTQENLRKKEEVAWDMDETAVLADQNGEVLGVFGKIIPDITTHNFKNAFRDNKRKAKRRQRKKNRKARRIHKKKSKKCTCKTQKKGEFEDNVVSGEEHGV